MQVITKFFSDPAVWLALAIGIAATILTSPVAKMLRAIVLFIPKSIGGEFADLLRFAPILLKARGDALSATAYIGAELGSLIINCSLALLTAGFYYAVITATSGWLATYHTLLLIVVMVALIVFVFHIFKRMLLLRLLFAMVLTPPTVDVKASLAPTANPSGFAAPVPTSGPQSATDPTTPQQSLTSPATDANNSKP